MSTLLSRLGFALAFFVLSIFDSSTDRETDSAWPRHLITTFLEMVGTNIGEGAKRVFALTGRLLVKWRYCNKLPGESLDWRQVGMLFGRVYDCSDGASNNLWLIQVNFMSAGRNHDLPAVC